MHALVHLFLEEETAITPCDIEATFALPLARSSQIKGQQQRQRGWKLCSFHAPETECIGKGKASALYEFGVKVSIVTTNARAPGSQFVLHAKAFPGNRYDGHTLKAVIEETQKLAGCESSGSMSTRDTAVMNTENPRRVLCPAKSVAWSAPLSANCGVDPPSSQSSAT